jgi:hypothetical protein
MSDNARAPNVSRPWPGCATYAKDFLSDEHRSAGGARRDRTDDLLLAKQALSQLSYGPFREQESGIGNQEDILPDA